MHTVRSPRARACGAEGTSQSTTNLSIATGRLLGIGFLVFFFCFVFFFLWFIVYCLGSCRFRVVFRVFLFLGLLFRVL